jgi:hypothetical protein
MKVGIFPQRLHVFIYPLQWVLNHARQMHFSLCSNGCAFGIPRLHLFSGAIIVPGTSTNRPLIFPLVPVAPAFVSERLPCIRIWLNLSLKSHRATVRRRREKIITRRKK